MSDDNGLHLADMLPVIREQLAAGRTVTFSPGGVSMRPMLEGGRDRVTLSPLPEKLRRYDLPLYLRPNGQLVLHRIVKPGDPFVCMGDNQFSPEPVRREQMIALVTAFRRKGRDCSVNAPGYRIYCALHYRSRHIRKIARRLVSRLSR